MARGKRQSNHGGVRMGVDTPVKTPKIKGKPTPGCGGFDFEQIEHIVKPDDPDTALCGVDQTDVPWNMGWPPCQACMAIARGQMN